MTAVPAEPVPGDDAAFRRPSLVIEPGRIPLAQYVRDLLHHRDLIDVLGRREIKLRYRQTALGATWVILQPLLSAGILGFVFGRIAGLPTDGIPYFVFAFAGMLAWTAFSSTVTRTTGSLVANAPLIAKVFFPRLILPLATVISVLLDFGIGFVMLIVMLVATDLLPGPGVLLVPFWLVLLVMIGQGIGSFLAALSVRYRDVPHITPVLLQLGLYLSPVAYSVAAVPDRYRELFYLNPVAGLIQGFRSAVLGTPNAPAGALVWAVAASVIVFCVGFVALQRLERGFADVI